MTQYRTNNPLGSMAPRDLYDNAQNIDNWSNGEEPFYEDRFGVMRRSFSGMNFEFEAAQTGRNAAFDSSQADKESRFQAFLVSSGYVSKGDYAAGVVLAERNEYVAVDSTTTGTTAGLYRPNASATLPLTLTGTWATDSANLVLLGDDVLRQELAAETGAEMVGYGHRSVKEALDNRAQLLTENLSVLIPTDYPTLQAAIDTLSELKVKQGVRITLMLESGYSLTSGVSITGGDYGHFSIKSEDPVVSFSAPIGGPFLYANNAVAPVLDCLIDGNGMAFRGCYYINTARGEITTGSGVINVRERGLYAGECSTVSAGGCNFSGAGTELGEFGRALWVTRGSTVNCEGGNFTGVLGNSTAIYISRASTVHAAYANISTLNGDHAVWLHRASRFNAQESFISGGKEATLNVTRGSMAVINGASVSECLKIGINSLGATVYASEGVTVTPAASNTGEAIYASGGGRIHFTGSTVAPGFRKSAFANSGSNIDASGSTFGLVTTSIGVEARRGSTICVTNASVKTGAAGNDLRVTEGSIISANGATTTNSITAGVPLVTDTYVNGRGGFNAIAGANGIIWS